MAHRIYWEKTEDHEGIFIQLPYKIIYYQKDEATGVFEKIFQDNAESLQCVRPQFEKKKRWFYAQKVEQNTVIKYVTLGEKATKEAAVYEDSTLWAMSIFQQGQHGENEGQQYFVTLDNRRKIFAADVNWNKASSNVFESKKENRSEFFLT